MYQNTDTILFFFQCSGQSRYSLVKSFPWKLAIKNRERKKQVEINTMHFLVVEDIYRYTLFINVRSIIDTRVGCCNLNSEYFLARLR